MVNFWNCPLHMLFYSKLSLESIVMVVIAHNLFLSVHVSGLIYIGNEACGNGTTFFNC